MKSVTRPNSVRLAVALAMPSLLLSLAAGAAESEATGAATIRVTGDQVQITKAIKVGSNPALRNVVVRASDFTQGQREMDLGLLPPPTRQGAAGMTSIAADRVVQSHATASPLGVTRGTDALGIGNGFVGPAGPFQIHYAPPDTSGAVGDTQYVQVVNAAMAVFDKATKKPILGAIPTNALWQGFGGICEADNNGDGTVVFDKAAHRWVVSQFAVNGGFSQCVAVSKTNDATGGWWLYEFVTPGNLFNDYPKMGVWPDGYYETFNLFGPAGFAGALACAYDRSKMLDGLPATQQCFNLSQYGGVLPSDLDGAMAPPKGSPNFLVSFGSNSLNLWRFHVDWTNPSNTRLLSPAVVQVADFVGACGYGRSRCIEQKGAINRLDSLGDRMMYRLAYRNFGDHESLVASHAVDVGSGPDARTGVRWYEIRSPRNNPQVYQQSTYAPDGLSRWMPSVAMDKMGNIAVGYSTSGRLANPSVRYAARLESDPLNTLQAETTMIQGAGAQTFSLHRWGDYSAMTVDPSDDCTFWYSTEYLPANGRFNWSTRIGSFKLPTCE